MSRYRQLSAIDSHVMENAQRTISNQPEPLNHSYKDNDSPAPSTTSAEHSVQSNSEPVVTSTPPASFPSGNKSITGGNQPMNKSNKPFDHSQSVVNQPTSTMNDSVQYNSPSPNHPSQQSQQYSSRPHFPVPYNPGGATRPKRVNNNNNNNSNNNSNTPNFITNLLSRLRETPPHELINTSCQNAITVCTNIQSLAGNVNTLLQSFDSMWPIAKNLLSSYTNTLLSKESAPVNTSQTQDQSQPTYQSNYSQSNKQHTNPPYTNSYDKTYSATYPSNESPSTSQYKAETTEEYIPLYRRPQTNNNDKGVIETTPVQPQQKVAATQPTSNPTPPPKQPTNQEQPGPAPGPARMPSAEELQQIMSNPLIQNVLGSLFQQKNNNG